MEIVEKKIKLTGVDQPALLGFNDANLAVLESRFEATITVRGDIVILRGEPAETSMIEKILNEMIYTVQRNRSLLPKDVETIVDLVSGGKSEQQLQGQNLDDVILFAKEYVVKARGETQKEYYKKVRENDIVFSIGPAGTGKCIAADSLVLTDRGMVPIAELGAGTSPEDHVPVATTIHGVEGEEPASHVYNGGVSNTLRVVTRFGYEISTTPEHPLQVLTAGGELMWRRADLLQCGDLLSLQRGQRMFGTSTSIDDNVSGSSANIELDESLAYSMGKHTSSGVSNQVPAGTGLPSAILRAPEQMVSAFLRGLYDANATVDGPTGTILLSSVSGRLLRELQIVLLNLGVVSSRTIKREGERHSHTLCISSADSALFNSHIGSTLQQERASRQVGSLSPALYSLQPDSDAVEEIEQSGMPSCSSLLFLEIERIEPSRDQVYDLTVPGTHSFVANGFVNHNTFLAVAMAVAAYRNREVTKLVLARPAVEAGESLGFLPGDLKEKIDPYLRPLYDALEEMIPGEKLKSMMEKRGIEVVPLAYMRGRAQPLHSTVLTPDGFRTIGSLTVGEYVIGSDGNPTRVEGTYPQGEKEVYRVTMTDGTSTLCCGEHLWSVASRDDNDVAQESHVLETNEMMGDLRSRGFHRYEIPLLSSPVWFPPQEFTTDPYALGLLLGDESRVTSTSRAYASGASSQGEKLQDSARDVVVYNTSRTDYGLIADGDRVVGRMMNTVMPTMGDPELLESDLIPTFIPARYLYNTPDVRQALLQGLLDSGGGEVLRQEGTCHVRFTTTSPRLCSDLLFLVRSLGGVATSRVYGTDEATPGLGSGQMVNRREDISILEIALPEYVEPFRLQRKLESYRYSECARPARHIDSIEPAGTEQTICIRVAASDSLYITDDFILTHNTLNNAFVILDEAQNSTTMQMKMFLTRLGANSRAIVTGDLTQIDLPRNVESGLVQAEEILQGIDGIGFVYFDKSDVVRHRLVKDIIKAYEDHGVVGGL